MSRGCRLVAGGSRLRARWPSAIGYRPTLQRSGDQFACRAHDRGYVGDQRGLQHR